MKRKKADQQTTYNVGKQTFPPYFKKLGSRKEIGESSSMKDHTKSPLH